MYTKIPAKDRMYGIRRSNKDKKVEFTIHKVV